MTLASVLLLPLALTLTGTQTPVITLLNPSSARAGGEPFELIVYGANFLPGASVRWNGAARTTTYVTSGQLKAAIAAPDLKAGPVPITVANPTGEVSAVYVLVVTHAAPAISALNPQRATAGSSSLVLRITGQNFLRSGTVAHWNSNARPVTFVSPTEITTVLTSTDLASAQTATVAVSTVVQNTSSTTSTKSSTAASFTIDPPATITLQAVAPASIQAVTATNQQGSAGKPVAQPPGVVVRSQSGAAMPGVAVAFVVTSGGGSVVPATVTTDGSGTARTTSWTLGASAGPNTLVAKVTGLQAATFAASVPYNISIALPTLPPADLDLSYAQSSNPIVAGTRQTYTLKVFNLGGTNATGLSVRTDLPPDLNFISAIGDHGFSCVASGTVLNCASGVVNAGDSATIRVVMSLPLLATSGHTIQIASRVDPANTIVESNEANNLASAVTQTQAAIAPVASYVVNTRADLVELFKLAILKGYQFAGIPLDKDAEGKPGKCIFDFEPYNTTAMPMFYGRWETDNSILAPQLRCQFEFFKNRPLAPGWELRTATIEIWDNTVTFVHSPNTTPGSAFFSVLLNKRMQKRIMSLGLRGPVGKTWRDAFQ